MSQENVEVIRRTFEAYAAGDDTAALAAFDPQVEYDMTIRPDGRVFRGPDGVVEAMRMWTGTFESWRVELKELIDAGDRVVAVTEEVGHGKGSGVETKLMLFHVVTLRNSKVVHWKPFLEREEALEAVGLSE